MRDRLLAATADLREILNFAIPGVHFEKYGSRNQPWDHAVAQTVDEAWSRIDPSGLGVFEWYVVHVRWSVKPEYDRQDLDNLRLKPILDCLTAKRLWPDDDVRYVRAIYAEAVLVEAVQAQRAEVTVFGKPKTP